MDPYRFTLTRNLKGDGYGQMTFVMLNPSTADDVEDDPTIRRCISFAEREQCSRLLVVNLFAFRSTHPAALPLRYRGMGDNPSPEEVYAWRGALGGDRSRLIVVGWGAQTGAVGRLVGQRLPRFLEEVRDSRSVLHALGVTQDGSPRHPLYLRADAPLRVWESKVSVD